MPQHYIVLQGAALWGRGLAGQGRGVEVVFELFSLKHADATPFHLICVAGGSTMGESVGRAGQGVKVVFEHFKFKPVGILGLPLPDWLPEVRLKGRPRVCTTSA